MQTFNIYSHKCLDTSCPTCSYSVIKYASIFCDTRNRMFAPSEPTSFGSAMKIYKYIFAALTSLTFHVEHKIIYYSGG